jgi:hypothetical protein
MSNHGPRHPSKARAAHLAAAEGHADTMGTFPNVDIGAPAAEPQARKKTRRAAADARVTDLERKLQNVGDELQTTRGEMQSQEELPVTSEELQTVNHELQAKAPIVPQRPTAPAGATP